MSPILFRYVTREFLLPLACCLIAFTALFLINSVFDDLPDFLDRPHDARPGSRWQIAWYFLLLQPANMLNVLPMSVLLSSAFMVSMMAKHHEITAIRASGMSMTKTVTPVWLIALLLSAATFWIAESVVPSCTLRADRILSRWTETVEYRRRQAKLAYHNAHAYRDWFFEQFEINGPKTGIFIKQFRPDETTYWELQAESAQFDGNRWTFRKGAIIPFDEEGELPLDAERQTFESYTHPNLDETPNQILNHVRPAEQLSVRAILAVMDANPGMSGTARAAFHATLWYRVTFAFACLIGALLGIPLAMTRERGSAMRGLAYAVGLMIAYYMTSQIGLVLARNAYVPAFLGGAAPSLAFVVYGLVTMHRRR